MRCFGVGLLLVSAVIGWRLARQAFGPLTVACWALLAYEFGWLLVTLAQVLGRPRRETK